jgi:hemin uptake protein HemP
MVRPLRGEIALSAAEKTQAGEAASDSPGRSSRASIQRIKSEDLFRQMREVEIDHEGRIYRLRLTQLNKLILTA